MFGLEEKIFNLDFDTLVLKIEQKLTVMRVRRQK